jgi:hypothetical protein
VLCCCWRFRPTGSTWLVWVKMTTTLSRSGTGVPRQRCIPTNRTRFAPTLTCFFVCAGLRIVWPCIHVKCGAPFAEQGAVVPVSERRHVSHLRRLPHLLLGHPHQKQEEGPVRQGSGGEVASVGVPCVLERWGADGLRYDFRPHLRVARPQLCESCESPRSA